MASANQSADQVSRGPRGRRLEEPNAPVSSGVVGEHLRRRVAGAVVDREELELGEGLAEDRVEGCRQGRGE